MEVGYPVNFTPQGDTTQEALTKTVGLELTRIYANLVRLRGSASRPGTFDRLDATTQIKEYVRDLPATASLGAIYYVKEDKSLYTYKTVGGWVKVRLLRIPPATTTSSGSVEFGTLAGAQSEAPSPTKVIPAWEMGLQARMATGLPRGCIIMWQSAEIPEGWVECNGENGTPDLRNKFARGAETEEQNQTAGGADSITITATKMLAHTHTYNLAATSAAHYHYIYGTSANTTETHSHTLTSAKYTVVSGGTHSHTNNGGGEYIAKGKGVNSNFQTGTGTLQGRRPQNNMNNQNSHVHTLEISIAVQAVSGSHRHTLTGSSSNAQPPATTANGVTGGPSSTGTGYNHDTRPRHKHLIFIMKV